MIKINLTDDDWKIAKSIGDRRKIHNGSSNFSNKNVDSETIGALGELIVHKYYKITPTWIFGRGDSMDILINGNKVDIKSSLLKSNWNMNNLHLLVMLETQKADIYIQVFISQNREIGIIYGWAKKEDIILYGSIWEYENKKLYKLSCNLLRDMSELKFKPFLTVDDIFKT
jgi:hypothetical protein